MLAFAGNSLLCRLALKETGIDATSFTTIRILSGAAVLLLVVGMRGGALLLFGAVQATMLGYGFWRGEQLSRRRIAGFLCAFAGMVGLTLPGLAAPPLLGAILMAASGIAWGFFSIRGKGAGDPVLVILGSFARTARQA